MELTEKDHRKDGVSGGKWLPVENRRGVFRLSESAHERVGRRLRWIRVLEQFRGSFFLASFPFIYQLLTPYFSHRLVSTAYIKFLKLQIWIEFLHIL